MSLLFLGKQLPKESCQTRKLFVICGHEYGSHGVIHGPHHHIPSVKALGEEFNIKCRLFIDIWRVCCMVWHTAYVGSK